MEWKSAILGILLGFFLVLSSVFCAALAQIEEVHNVEIRGTQYQVTRLLHAKRDKIHPANILLCKRGSYFIDYKLLGSDDYVRIYESDKDFKRVKKELKGIPDFRTFQEAHPNYDVGLKIVNIGWSIAGAF